MLALELGDTCVELLDDGDLAEPGALRDRLERAVADRHHRQVVLDLSRLREITSAVVAVLVGAEASGATLGTPVAFACARRRVKRALAGLRDLLTIHGSVGRALEAIHDHAMAQRHRQEQEEDPRREAAMTDEPTREERSDGLGAEDGAGSEEATRVEADVVPEETPGAPPDGAEDVVEAIQEPVAAPEADAPAPARELPESVMQHLRETEPDLAGALTHEADPVEDAPPGEPQEAATQSQPEPVAMVMPDVAPEAVPVEIAPEPVPAAPESPEAATAQKGSARKRSARKSKPARKKRAAKRKKKTAKKGTRKGSRKRRKARS